MKVSEEELHKMAVELFQKWLEIQVMITQITSPNLEELTFLKARVDAPNGGLYFWTFIHVDGEKIKLKTTN